MSEAPPVSAVTGAARRSPRASAAAIRVAARVRVPGRADRDGNAAIRVAVPAGAVAIRDGAAA